MSDPTLPSLPLDMAAWVLPYGQSGFRLERSLEMNKDATEELRAIHSRFHGSEN